MLARAKRRGKCRKSPSASSCPSNVTAAWRRLQAEPTYSWRTPSLVLLSIAAYEQTWFVRDLLANAVYHARPDTRIVVHYNCHGLSADPVAIVKPLQARVHLNSQCITVARFCGSILHAHLLNFEFAQRQSAIPAAMPRFFVMQASNQRWIQPGWEAHAAAHVASVGARTHVNRGPPVGFSVGPDNVAVYDECPTWLFIATLRELVADTGCFTYANHEGAFYPSNAVSKFIPALKTALRRAWPRRTAGDDSDALALMDGARGAFEEYALSTWFMASVVHGYSRNELELAGGSARATADPCAQQHDGNHSAAHRLCLISTWNKRTPGGGIDLVRTLRAHVDAGIFAIKPVGRAKDDPVLEALHRLHAFQ